MVVTGDLGIPKVTLYVGDLHPDVTEAMLFEHFSRIGHLTTVRVCRDLLTKRSLGYAYVNFERHEDAASALQHLNYQPLKNRPMRIMWSERDPTQRRPNPSNVFVKNLDKDTTTKELHSLFSRYGTVTSCKVRMDGDNSKGFGFAQFATPEEAQEAIRQTNGIIFKGKALFVGPFVPKNQRVQQESTFRNLYVKNLPADMDDGALEALFDQYGAITSAKVMRGLGGVSLRHGFVCFSEHAEAAAAIDGLSGKKLQGAQDPLVVTRAQLKFERLAELKKIHEQKKLQDVRKGVNLYVKTLAETVDDDELRRLFQRFGTITSAKVMVDPTTNRSRGFGFVCFETNQEAASAIKGMHGERTAQGDALYVTYAQPKQERAAELQARKIQENNLRYKQTTLLPGSTFYLPAAMAQRAQLQGRMNARAAAPPRLGSFLPRPQSIPRIPVPGMYYQGLMTPQMTAIAQARAPHVPMVMADPPTLTMNDLANRSPEEIKQILGEKIFTAISHRFGDRANRITATIIEKTSSEEILRLLNRRNDLYIVADNAQELILAMDAKGAAGKK